MGISNNVSNLLLLLFIIAARTLCTTAAHAAHRRSLQAVNEEKGGVKVVTTAVVVSAVVATSAFCAVGLYCRCLKRFKKPKKNKSGVKESDQETDNDEINIAVEEEEEEEEKDSLSSDEESFHSACNEIAAEVTTHAPPPPPPPIRKPEEQLMRPKGPPPPPPPSKPYKTTPCLGKDGSSLPRLKPLRWEKVRAARNISTVWDHLKPSSFEFDEEMVESLFCYNQQNSMNDIDARNKASSCPTTNNKHLLEPKRLQNITILSKALNLTPDQVCDALLKGKGLVLRELEALAKMAPNKEEESKLWSYKGNIHELGSAEKFVKTILLEVPFAFRRVEAMLYQETFGDEVLHLTKSFSTIEEACKELRSSRLFVKLLQAVLKTGNRMNAGTTRGGATSFNLDALLKLPDIKAADGKTSLLHFIVQQIIRSEGLDLSHSIVGKIQHPFGEYDYHRMGLDLVSGLGLELCHVKKAATVDLESLCQSLSHLSRGMSDIKKLLQEDLAGPDPNKEDILETGNDSYLKNVPDENYYFAQTMGAFLKTGERRLKDLKEEEERVLGRVKEIREYFHGDDVAGGDEHNKNPLRIFVIVRDFLGMLDHVCNMQHVCGVTILAFAEYLLAGSPLLPDCTYDYVDDFRRQYAARIFRMTVA
ncbi:unnamed protein product [Cuscuta campestris]|uniref:Formin-like protein n=1 Tax=Cuscuta campestris TaxID=132261 RepID=A0A484NKB7_9ASTE|nr:unnamed protein product [Cuscuta campestris]